MGVLLSTPSGRRAEDLRRDLNPFFRSSKTFLDMVARSELLSSAAAAQTAVFGDSVVLTVSWDKYPFIQDLQAATDEIVRCFTASGYTTDPGPSSAPTKEESYVSLRNQPLCTVANIYSSPSSLSCFLKQQPTHY